MAISNKKAKAVLRGYPAKSIDELARELDLTAGQVRKVLRESGKMEARSWSTPALAFLAALLTAAVGFFGYRFLTAPCPATRSTRCITKRLKSGSIRQAAERGEDTCSKTGR